jgi:flagellar basal body-associated protein FliL
LNIRRGELLRPNHEKGAAVSILWVVIIVILVLALLGFFGRGRFYG